jgi:hypothetical protein
VAEQVAVKAQSSGLVVATALKMSAMLFLLVRVGAFVFGAWWGAVAEPEVRGLLQMAHLPNTEAAVTHVFGLTIFPFNMAILVVLAPLFGWWVYSRVDKPRQDAVGWVGALFYAVADAALAMIFAGAQHALGFDVNLVVLTIGEAVIILWLMFFMGVGFNVAKLFKAPL